MRCIVCDHELSSWGGIHYHTRVDVAGLSASSIYPGGRYRILKCRSCGLGIKFPLPSARDLVSLYERSPGNQWGICPSSESRQFARLERLARKFFVEGGNVLDFGCSNGALLAAWSAGWSKYGVELSEPARRIAEQRGIAVWPRLADIDTNIRFDVVVMSDVVEHIPDVLGTMRAISSLLNVGGVVVMMTGCTDFWFWRFAKGGYWYCDIPEHVVFFGRKSISKLASLAGFRVYSIEVTAHLGVVGRAEYWKQFFKNVLFLGVEKFRFGANQRTVVKRTTYPNFHSASDHMIATLVRVE